MRKFQRHRRTLTWIASISGAAIVASFGATAVLAEDTACVVDGTPITKAQYAEDPTLCPEGSTATEPAPTEPAPTEPAPTEPAPTEPAPTEPAPTEPAPTEPAPTEPAPTEPAPTEPAPTEPAPTTTTPAPPAPTTETRQETAPTPARPKPARPVAPKPAAPRPVAKPKPTPQVERTQGLVKAKQFQAAPFRDARLFREQFEPKGRIPAQPELDAERAKLLFDAAKGTGTSWSTLTAVAWLESRWGDPSAGGLVGRRLTAAAWVAHGTDGDGDGTVDRSSPADQARTVAVFLAEARSSRRDALQAYFSGTRRKVMAARSVFLADYFEALGKQALVHGLDDPEVRAALEERVLANEDVEVYDGGRGDIEAGLVDPRVLVTMEFLANRFGSVTISSIISGHGVYTSSGNVSLHSYGQAVDIAALGGESILGHQQRKSRTWRAVREVLLLPDSMEPAELISLWDMGGPSFALADHHDHIHIGWKTEAVATFGQDEHGHED